MRVSVASILLLAIAIPAMGQVNPGASENWQKGTFKTETDYLLRDIRILANDANDGFIVLYTYLKSGKYILIARGFASDCSSIDEESVIATSKNAISYDAVWHNNANRMMVAYTEGDLLKCRPVNANGEPLGKARKLDKGAASPRVSWTGANKFIVFYAKSNQVRALTVFNTGKIYKQPRDLTKFKKGTAFPSASSTEWGSLAAAGSPAACYIAYYKNPAGNKMIPYMFRVNENLNIVKKLKLSGKKKDVDKMGILGAFDPDTGTHAIAYSNFYSLIDMSGNSVAPSAAAFKALQNGGNRIAVIQYDGTYERFAFFYQNATQTLHEIRAAFIAADGTIQQTDWLLDQTAEAVVDFGAGMNSTGCRLGIFTWKASPKPMASVAVHYQ